MSAVEFGKCLRFYRERSIALTGGDSQTGQGRLTQARLGEEVGQVLGLAGGYSGAAVSEWERGRSAISAQDRPVLLAIVEVLRRHRRIEAPPEADHLLTAGGYRPLNGREQAQLFPHMTEPDSPAPTPEDEIVIRPGSGLRRLGAFFRRPVSVWSDDLWDRLVGRVSQRSPTDFLGVVAWVGLWWATVQAVFPFLRLPLADYAAAAWSGLSFVLMTVVGSIVLGVLIAWGQPASAPSAWSRVDAYLFAVQGASLGYQVGSVLLFVIALSLYFVIGTSAPVGWVAIGAALLPISLGAWGARRLTSRPQTFRWTYHGVFFVNLGLSALWAGLFLYTFPFMQDRAWGPWVLIGAAIGAAAISAITQWRTGQSTPPLAVWVGIYGVIALGLEWQATGDAVAVGLSAGVIVALVGFSLVGQIRATLGGALAFALSFVAVCVLLQVDRGWGIGVGLLIVAFWLSRGQRWFRFPWRLWLIIVASGGAQGWLGAHPGQDTGAILAIFYALWLIVLVTAWCERTASRNEHSRGL